MAADEILEHVESLGIIIKIGNSYMITEKYKELLTGSSAIKLEPVKGDNQLNLAKLMDTATNGTEWPIQITGAQGHERATNFCDLCEVPRFAAKGYPLRGFDKDAINILGNIIVDVAIESSKFIESIKIYYKHSSMPKALKNLLKEGDVFEIYKAHLEGSLLKSVSGDDGGNKDNQHWS
jgi:hypothetical protein